MENIKDVSKEFINNDLRHALLKDYVVALKDEDFKKLVTRLKLKEDTAMKYTAKLERTVCELKNCSKCKSLEACKNKVNGCVYYPKVEDDKVNFDYVACKYKKEWLEIEKNRPLVFEEPAAIVNAKMADIDLGDKKRTHVIKWVHKFYKDYQKDKHIKGCYLHGSFGSGKSFILAALINEIAKSGAKCTMIYYPEMLRVLKESFSDDFDTKMNKIKTSDVLLIDDRSSILIFELEDFLKYAETVGEKFRTTGFVSSVGHYQISFVYKGFKFSSFVSEEELREIREKVLPPTKVTEP